MLDFRSRILFIAAAFVFMISTFLSPAFAASTVQIENSKHGFLDFGEDFPFGEMRFNRFFDNFFNKKFTVQMDGAQEVPGPGDVDGDGEASVRIKPGDNQLCVDMEVKYIEKASAAHVHHAPKGTAGAVVVVLPIPDDEGKAGACIDVESNLLKKIRDNPEDYYINIHNNSFPNGAIRGQLSR